jgi:hypothetical protein
LFLWLAVAGPGVLSLDYLLLRWLRGTTPRAGEGHSG